MRMVVGSPTFVRETYEELLARSGADELMLMGSTHGAAERLRSYELIAEAFGLSAGSAGSGGRRGERRGDPPA